jgi:MSHA biogenesis protein MshM
LIQVVLFGQPELDTKLANPAVRQIRQRIVFHYRLPPFDLSEVGPYLAHRLRVAGHPTGDVFSAGAVSLVQRFAGGTPRLLNILAHKSMLLAFGEGTRAVTHTHVRAAGRDTESARKIPWWRGG